MPALLRFSIAIRIAMELFLVVVVGNHVGTIVVAGVLVPIVIRMVYIVKYVIYVRAFHATTRLLLTAAETYAIILVQPRVPADRVHIFTAHRTAPLLGALTPRRDMLDTVRAAHASLPILIAARIITLVPEARGSLLVLIVRADRARILLQTFRIAPPAADGLIHLDATARVLELLL